MAQINARDWIFEVSEDGGTAWNELGEVTSFNLSPSTNEESVDTTSFASAGVYEGQAMQRGASLTVDGKRDPNDVGQTSVETVAALVGDASLVDFRFRHTDDTDWTRWSAWVSQGDQGGGNNDKTSWSATFTRSGAATTEAVV